MASESPSNTPRQPSRPQGRRSDAASAPGSRRRIVTALCYDLVGSTDLFHQLDIEDYQELITAFQKVAQAVIARHSGVMRVEAGDGGLALFPIELGARDAASLAIGAGLDIIKTCRRVGRELGRGEMRVRVGIATSIALVQDGSEENWTQEPVTGAALAMAARLEGLASPNCVLVSDQTRALAGRAYAFAFEGTQLLKGFFEPEKLWRANEHRNEIDRFYAFGRLGGSFVGRLDELQAIGESWERVLSGQGEIVLIEGEAGIGKSRLLREIRRLTRRQRFRSVLLQCSPGGSRSVLHPLLHGLPAEVSEKGGGQLRPAISAVAAQFAGQGITDPDVVDIFAHLLGAAGRNELSSGSDPKVIRDKARRAVLPALTAMSAGGPLVLAVEDLHWIDPTSQDLLLEAARMLAQLPILLVVTTRPTETPIEWPQEARLIRLPLMPLNAQESRRAIEEKWPQHRLSALPELIEVAERLAGGVPLFIEEICQWVSETSATDASQMSGKMSGGAARGRALAFETILDERLSRLGPARDVARAAAVVGGRVTLPLLSALLPDIGRRQLASAADLLCEAGFLMRSKTARGIFYDFRHALIQETIYRALTRKQRQVFHRRLFGAVGANRGIAAWFDTGALAEQAERAGLIENAAGLFIVAGAESSGRAAMIEARDHLEHALALCERLGAGGGADALRLSALTALGPIMTGLVGLNSPPARKLYEDGVAIARRQPREEQSKWFPVYWGWWLTGPDFLVMHDRALEVQTMLSGTEDPEIALQVRHCIWAIDFNLGWHRETQDAVMGGLALYDERSADTARTLYGGHDAKVCGLGQLALSLWLTGQTVQADQALKDMIMHVERIAHVPSTAHALDTEAVSAFYRDDYERLSEVANRMKLFSKKHEMQSLFGLSLLFDGWAKAHSDDLATGHEMFREGLALLRELGAVADLPIYLYMHALMLGRAYRYEQAIAVATDAIKEAKATGHAYWLAELYRARAVLRAQGNIKTELVAAELLTAMTIAESQGAMALLARASRSTRELGIVIER